MKNTRLSGARVRIVRLAAALALLGVPGLALTASKAEAASVASAFDPSSWEDAEIGDINTKVFATALKAASTAIARGDVKDPGTLTVIDFSRPSTQRRMWVYDL